MKVLKFGGSSLANGQGIENSLAIIEKRAGEEITIVVSARGNSTDELEELLMLAAEGKPFSVALTNFFKYQKNAVPALNLGDEFNDLDNILHAV